MLRKGLFRSWLAIPHGTKRQRFSSPLFANSGLKTNPLEQIGRSRFRGPVSCCICCNLHCGMISGLVAKRFPGSEGCEVAPLSSPQAKWKGTRSSGDLWWSCQYCQNMSKYDPCSTYLGDCEYLRSSSQHGNWTLFWDATSQWCTLTSESLKTSKDRDALSYQWAFSCFFHLFSYLSSPFRSQNALVASSSCL